MLQVEPFVTLKVTCLRASAPESCAEADPSAVSPALVTTNFLICTSARSTLDAAGAVGAACAPAGSAPRAPATAAAASARRVRRTGIGPPCGNTTSGGVPVRRAPQTGYARVPRCGEPHLRSGGSPLPGRPAACEVAAMGHAAKIEELLARERD